MLKARKLIHELYAADFSSREPASRKQLATTLVRKAGERDDDAVSRYALLSEAHELAVSSGNLATAVAAVDAMAVEYMIDGFAMKEVDFNKLAAKSVGSEAREVARQIGHDLTEQALAAGHATSTKDLANTVESLAAGRSAAIVASTHAWAIEVRALIPLAVAGRDAIDGGAAQSDGRAATTAGTFLCTVAADWDRGLPLLSRGSDATLGALAKQELKAKGSRDPAEMATAAAGWLGYAAKQPPALRMRVAAHAQALYEAARPLRQGLSRIGDEKRESEAAALATGHWMVDVLALADPTRDAVGNVTAWRADRGVLVATAGEQTRLQLPYRAPTEYDFTVEYIRTKDTNDIFLILPKDDRSFQFDHGARQGECWFGQFDGKPWGEGRQVMGALRNGIRHRCTVEVRDGGTRAFIDGKAAMSLQPTDYSRLHPHPDFTLKDSSCLGIGCWHCTVVFETAEVIEVRGRGQLMVSAISPASR